MPAYSLVQWESQSVVVRLTCFGGLQLFLWEVRFRILTIVTRAWRCNYKKSYARPLAHLETCLDLKGTPFIESVFKEKKSEDKKV